MSQYYNHGTQAKKAETKEQRMARIRKKTDARRKLNEEIKSQQSHTIGGVEQNQKLKALKEKKRKILESESKKGRGAGGTGIRHKGSPIDRRTKRI